MKTRDQLFKELWVAAHQLLHELGDASMSMASWKHVQELEQAVEAAKDEALKVGFPSGNP